MDIVLEYFTNEKYGLLKLLCENQVNIKGAYYASLSQQEIADMSHISKLKANKIINELIEKEYLCRYKNKRGKYALTDKGMKVINFFKNN